MFEVSIFLVIILSIYFAIKQCVRKRIVWGLLNILLTVVTCIIYFFFSFHRNWYNYPAQSEWNYLVQELLAFNPTAYLVLILFVAIVTLIVYNAKQVVNIKNKEV